MNDLSKDLKTDVRLLKREMRNSHVGTTELDQRMDTLPDAAENARWMHPDGTECSQEEQVELLKFHDESGWTLSFGSKE